MIDPLAMTVGADPTAVDIDARDDPRHPRRVRPQHEPRRLQRLVRAAQPPRAQRRASCAIAADAGLTSAIMDARTPQMRDGRARRRPAARPATSGARTWIAALPRGGRRARHEGRDGGPSRHLDAGRAARRPRPRPAALRAERRRGARAAGRDASSTPRRWNGVAIDSTCGGHGTCKKCRVRVDERRRCRSRSSTPAPSRPTSCATAGGSPAAPRPTSDLVVDVPPLADAAEGGDGRRRPPGDPAPGRRRSATSSSTSRR